MRYLCTAVSAQVPYRDDRGRTRLAAVVSGDLLPVEVTAADAAQFIARGFVKEISDAEAAQPRSRPPSPLLFAIGW